MRLEAADGAFVDGSESIGPHHSGRRPAFVKEHLDLDADRSNAEGSMSSLPALCECVKEGNVGAIFKTIL